jgi:hypothetical protein
LQDIARVCSNAVEEIRRNEDSPLITLEYNLCSPFDALATGNITSKCLYHCAPTDVATNHIDFKTDSSSACRRRTSGEKRGQIRFYLAVYVHCSATVAMAIRYGECIYVGIVENTFARVGHVATFAGHHSAEDVNACFFSASRYGQVREISS